MKRIACLLISLAAGLTALAQTPEQILSRMEEAMGQYSEKDGMAMTLEMKIPILGKTTSTTYTLGEKMRMDVTAMGAKVTTWSDETTTWTYDSRKNVITINDRKEDEESDSKASDSEADMEMFTGVADGYDVTIKKQDAEAWYLLCKKSKDNKDKDDPKTMDIAVYKKNYHPKSLSAKMSGITVTISGISYGVKEEQVTFNINKYPGATIEDKRKK